MGQKEFTETEIRLAVMGIAITIIKSHIASIIGVARRGVFMIDTDKKSVFAPQILRTLFDGAESKNVKDMKVEHINLFKIMIPCLIPRDSSTNKIAWDHKHLLMFILKNYNMDLPTYIFNHL